MTTQSLQKPGNSLEKRMSNGSIGAYFAADNVKKKINEIMGGEDGSKFISSVVSAVSVNPALAACDHGTILSAALLGHSLKLSPSPQLGQYYMVPFKCKELVNGRKHGLIKPNLFWGIKAIFNLPCAPVITSALT
ncbi:recombinational DNA repair protein RecT [Elusimicrobium posterum]|uniref:hypothetical protein n=1 Tax=Elusimicrobium posterum TaxID=3116653 RepID=UPI003C779E2D